MALCPTAAASISRNWLAFAGAQAKNEVRLLAPLPLSHCFFVLIMLSIYRITLCTSPFTLLLKHSNGWIHVIWTRVYVNQCSNVE